MPLLALAVILLSACTHATWNLAAKKAASARHFVFWYSAISLLLYLPVILYLVIANKPDFTPTHWLALLASGVLHIGYSLSLQSAYRHADLSLVYPLARGSGPLLSFLLAVLLLGEHPTLLSWVGLLLIVSGIVLVTGLLQRKQGDPFKGSLYGIGTGMFVALYTVTDGWAVKTLVISPFLVDYASQLLRTLVLGPNVLSNYSEAMNELKDFRASILTVSLLGPLGYILVLFAMQLAPISHVAPARELSTLVGTWFGARLLQEKSAPSRLIGAGCIVIGVISLAFA